MTINFMVKGMRRTKMSTYYITTLKGTIYSSNLERNKKKIKELLQENKMLALKIRRENKKARDTKDMLDRIGFTN